MKVYDAPSLRNVAAVGHSGAGKTQLVSALLYSAGAVNRFADPVYVEDVAKDFPELTIVLAHGGRGWWYDAAAFLTLMREHVWIELSGLPPKKLPEYYARHDLERLGRKLIFGTDWPSRSRS